MRRVIGLVLLLLTLIAPPTLAQTLTADEVTEQVRESVVTVYTWTDGGTFSPGRTGREPTGAGSGWAYTDDGIIVTNAHVVDGADRVEIVTATGTTIPADVVGSDWYHDVAVLRLTPGDDEALPLSVPVGASSIVRAGDPVLAIGTPGGRFANTVSTGHVAATGVSLNTGAGYSLTHLIRHDAAIAPGNSGGPLMSMGGEVIGMNAASAEAGGTDDAPARIAFAIESDTVVATVDEILTTGSVARPYLGIQTRETESGDTVVTDLVPSSPAAEASIQPGDTLIAVDGVRIDAAHTFIDLLYLHEAGDIVRLTIEREGSQREVEVVPGERPGGV